MDQPSPSVLIISLAGGAFLTDVLHVLQGLRGYRYRNIPLGDRVCRRSLAIEGCLQTVARQRTGRARPGENAPLRAEIRDLQALRVHRG